MGKKVIDILPPDKSTVFVEKNKTDLPSCEKQSVKLKKTLKCKKGLILFPFFLILLGAFCFFNLPKADIEIWPETEFFALKTKLTADAKAKEINLANKIIPAEFFSKEKSINETFQSSGEIAKEEKAEGIIKLYNAYSASPQTLIPTTRFVSVDGKVFRTPVSVTIPGGTYEKGKLVPGEIDIRVVADQSGPEYNISPSTFSIPGFAGTDKYTAFYAKSFQPMTGGLQEKKPLITAEDLARAEDYSIKKAQKECEELLIKELQASDFSLKFNYFSNEIKTEIIEKFSLANENEEVKEFNFQVKAKCETLLFQRSDLERFAEEVIISQSSGEKKPYRESLQIDYFLEGIDLNNGKINLDLDISSKIYSELDINIFKHALSGKSALEARLFLESQPEIAKSVIYLWPFWVKNVPEDADKIKIDLIF